MTSKASKLKRAALANSMQIDTAIELLTLIAAKTPDAARLSIEVESDSRFERIDDDTTAKRRISELRNRPDWRGDPAPEPIMSSDAKLRHLHAYLTCWKQSLYEAKSSLVRNWNPPLDQLRIERATRAIADLEREIAEVG